MHPDRQCTAFEGDRRLASGLLTDVAAQAKAAVDRGAQVLVFDEATSEPVEIDFRGTVAEVLQRLAPASEPPVAAVPRGPGRPKLGVVAREVTLLPRHWEWLSAQPGGASVALRRLVDEARRTSAGRDRIRQSQEAAYRFISTMAGNLPDFEEATRALFAREQARFEQLIGPWPHDVRAHASKLATASFE
jgi:uncharacterized protein